MQSDVLELRVHSLPRCDLPNALRRGQLAVQALGDFPATNDSAEVLALDSTGQTLKFPAATRAAVARVVATGSSFWGYGEQRGGGLDLLLWPDSASCTLARAQAYPGKGGGQAVAYAADRRSVLVAGGNDPLHTDSIVGSLLFDAATGSTSRHGADEPAALQRPRAFATATRFGDGFLVAGGEQPVAGVPELELELEATAEVFGAEGSPTRSIPLGNKRTHHAAIELVDGRTLLVGGRSRVGSSSIAQYQLELVDPQTSRASVGDAIEPRIEPRVVRLSDARIFVGGGLTLDGSPVTPSGQWLSPQGKLEKTKLDLAVPARFGRAFAATEGGGVLAVGGCEDRPPASDSDAESCIATCARGCPPLNGYDAWWIDSQGVATPVSLAGIDAPNPTLLPGSDGSPWLLAHYDTDEANPPPQLFRFNPWAASFEPASAPAELRLPPAGTTPLALDPDTFVWVDEDAKGAELVGLRLGTRNRYEQDLALVLRAEPTDPTRPLHLVPTSPANGSLSYDGSLIFRDEKRRKALDSMDLGPATAVVLADADFEDLTVELHLMSGAPPRVLLGATELGGVACPWPTSSVDPDDALPTVLRSGERAELHWHGDVTACRVETGRLRLGLLASTGISVVSRLDVKRGVPARSAP